MKIQSLGGSLDMEHSWLEIVIAYLLKISYISHIIIHILVKCIVAY